MRSIVISKFKLFCNKILKQITSKKPNSPRQTSRASSYMAVAVLLASLPKEIRRFLQNESKQNFEGGHEAFGTQDFGLFS